MANITFLTCLLLLTWVSAAPVPSHQRGKPLQVIDITDGTFTLREDNLKTILASVPDKTEVGIISIAGEYRKGKSFLLNFFLQYLRYRRDNGQLTTPAAHFEELIQKKQHPWLTDINRNFGFQFKSGTARETTGINIWSEPFIITAKDGKQIGVLVMDSQGLYDEETSANDNTRLFTMVSMLSSTLMLNTPQNLNFNQLKELKYFLNYATLSINISPELKLFQTLSFIIRDYDLTDEQGYIAGGQILHQFMKKSTQPDIHQIAANLTKGFTRIEAFTLPHPGSKVVKKEFDGSLKNIDVDFLQSVDEYVTSIVDNIEPRHPMVYNLTAVELLPHIRSLVTNFNKQLPPDELVRLQEAQFAHKVNDVMQRLLTEYNDALGDYIHKSNKTLFIGQSDIEMEHGLDAKELEMRQIVIQHLSQSVPEHFILRFSDDDNHKPVTAQQVFASKLTALYQEKKERLLQLLFLKRSEAEIIQGQLDAAKKQNQQEIEDLKKRLEENQAKQKGFLDHMTDAIKIGNQIVDLLGKLKGLGQTTSPPTTPGVNQKL